jgi:signal transduction histidine kinase
MHYRPSPATRDVALAAALAIGAQAELWLTDAVPAGPTAGNVLLEVLITVPLVWRRRHPMIIGLGVQAIYALGTLVVAPGDLLFDSIAVFLVAPYTAAVGARSWRTSVLAGVVSCALLGLQGLIDPFYGNSAALANMLYGVLVWSVAAAVRVHAQRALAAVGNTERIAAEAVAQERARLARELHDVVAHGLSIVVLQSRGARHALHTDRDAAARAMHDIEQVARRALVDMRHLLNLLRDDGNGRAEAREPQPGLDRLDELVEPIRRTGLDVDVRIEGDQRPLTRGLDVSLYRIAQESLTNVLRHSDARHVMLAVRWLGETMELEISDDGHDSPTTGSGHGLIGMRERVEVLGGTLIAGPQPTGGFTVRARLPVAEA